MKTTSRAMVFFATSLFFAALAVGQPPADRTPTNRQPRLNGTFTDRAGGQGVFSGTVALGQFDVQNGNLVVSGTLRGALADSSGNPVGPVDEAVVLPAAVIDSTCDGLRLTIGPARVDLGGVSVQLEKDTLGITGRDGVQPGIGSALCAAARVIGSPAAAPAAIATALNGVIRAIG